MVHSHMRQEDSSNVEPLWLGYCWAVGSVVIATTLFLLVNRQLDLSRYVDLLYLPIVLACAHRFGLGPASSAAIVGVLCWDFFFIQPVYSFHIGSPRDVLILAVFLCVSTVTARLADRVQRKTSEAAVLEERNRMAREMHDTLAQGLTGIVIQLQAAERLEASDVDSERAAVRQARILAEQCLDEARRSVKAIKPRPLEQRTLPEALKVLMEQMTHGLPICTSVLVKGAEFDLPEQLESNLLRIGQEALTNALRHATPHKLEMTVAYESTSVSLRVQDDGCGFDAESVTVSSTSFGLAGMRERAVQMKGKLTLISGPRQGTLVEAVVPITRREIPRQRCDQPS